MGLQIILHQRYLLFEILCIMPIILPEDNILLNNQSVLDFLTQLFYLKKEMRKMINVDKLTQVSCCSPVSKEK